MSDEEQETGEEPIAASMDPRIRARRIDVRREAGLRRLRLLLSLVVGVAIVGGVVLAARSEMLDVDEIVVDGNEHLDPERVVELAGVEPGSPLVTIDTARIAAAVEADPWVSSATAVRSWPTTLEITVSERQPVALVATAAGQYLVADDGTVLESGSVAGLPLLVLPEGREISAGDRLRDEERTAVTMLGDLPPTAASSLGTAWLDTDGQLIFDVRPEVAPHAVVRFGYLEEIPEKIRAVETVLTRVVLDGLAVLDVTVPATPRVLRDEAFLAELLDERSDSDAEADT